jgi:hypothetical protein
MTATNSAGSTSQTSAAHAVRDLSATFTANPPSVSGAGGQLPQGPTGPQGETGVQGQIGPTALTGPTGPQGPPGKVVCKKTAAASLVCSLQFTPGTWTTAGRRIVTRHVNLRHRRMTVRLGRRLRPGRYVVTVTVTSGHRHTTLLRQRITIRAAR